MRLLRLVLLAAFTLQAQAALACVVCIPFPEDTAVDHLVNADAVVLAREDAEKPFSYRAVELLKGELADPQIGLFINSINRRRLKANPDRAVVLVRDGGSGAWRALGFASAEYEALIRGVLAHAGDWKGGSRAAARRAAFFLPYLASGDRTVHDLAYLETGRAPYTLIRRADRFVAPERIKSVLGDIRYIEWQSLYILLLGINASAEEKALIQQKMTEHSVHNSTLNLGAWATALIETGGIDAVDWLERTYIGHNDRPEQVVSEILKALSVHGGIGPGPVRDRIVRAYATLLDTHPALAGPPARDLAGWGEWGLAERFAEFRSGSQGLDPATAYAIDYYIAQATGEISN